MRLISFVFVLMLVACFQTRVLANEQLVFGVTPWKNSEELYKIHEPLIHYLEKRLNRKIIFVVAEDYKDLANKIEQQLIDIGSFSANAYVEAKNRFPGLKYLVSVQKKDTQGILKSYYHGVIVTLRSSDIESLHDLKGKRFGFTDKQSSSGYIYPRLLLKNAGIDPGTHFSQTFFVKKHSKIIGALLKGSIDAGATYEDLVINAATEHGDKFRLIATTPDIPFDAFAAGRHVSRQLCQDIQKGLVDASITGVFSSAPADGGPQGFAVHNDSYYDFIREANRSLTQNNAK